MTEDMKNNGSAFEETMLQSTVLDCKRLSSESSCYTFGYPFGSLFSMFGVILSDDNIFFQIFSKSVSSLLLEKAGSKSICSI